MENCPQGDVCFNPGLMDRWKSDGREEGADTAATEHSTKKLRFSNRQVRCRNFVDFIRDFTYSQLAV